MQLKTILSSDDRKPVMSCLSNIYVYYKRYSDRRVVCIDLQCMI